MKDKIKTALIVTASAGAIIAVGMTPFWVRKSEDYTNASYTSADLSQHRDNMVYSSSKPCVGTSSDTESWYLDRKLKQSADEVDTVISATSYVSGHCLEDVMSHYKNRGFVVLLSHYVSKDGSQKVSVIAESDYDKENG